LRSPFAFFDTLRLAVVARGSSLADESADPANAPALLEEARQELEALTCTLAHDLRAPLRTVDGFARALREDCGGQLGEDGRRYLQHVLDAAQRMSVMLEGLLGLARLGRAELHPAPLELSAIARRILERLRAAEPARPIEVVIADGLAAEADPPLMTAALEALLQNAWKFTRGRDPARIEVGMRPTTPRTYFVCDNGCGFDMRYADKLFGPFQRLHSQQEFEGAGVGLAAAQRVIRRHGGRIWAQAEPDRGASFYFTLAR
jgi:light-regulated signal transduction histidine kinase (bacteriophytochrome)